MICQKLFLRKRDEEAFTPFEKLSAEEAMSISLSTMDLWSNDYCVYSFAFDHVDHKDPSSLDRLRATVLNELSRSLNLDSQQIESQFKVVFD